MERGEFCFGSDEVSHGARLWGNLLGLMCAHAWLEQRNREIMEFPGGDEAVVATPEDYEAAYGIFEETCERSVVNLSETHRKILDATSELKREGEAGSGYSLRKIAEKASIHHSTVAEHKAYLTKSVKLLRELEGGGLDLVAAAEPSWWQKGDLLVGLPHPEQVWRWWGERDSRPDLESTRQGRQPQPGTENPLICAESPVGLTIRHPSDTIRQHTTAGEVSGSKPAVSGEVPDSENSLGKPKTEDSKALSGVSGAFGADTEESTGERERFAL